MHQMAEFETRNRLQNSLQQQKKNQSNSRSQIRCTESMLNTNYQTKKSEANSAIISSQQC
jgi:hypothetical protein